MAEPAAVVGSGAEKTPGCLYLLNEARCLEAHLKIDVLADMKRCRRENFESVRGVKADERPLITETNQAA